MTGLGTDRGNDGVIRAIMEIARAMGVETIAEGIEYAGELDRLKLNSASTQGQGYYFSRPVEADSFVRSCSSR